MNTHAAITGAVFRWVQVLACAVAITMAASADEEQRRHYDLPAGEAAATLRQFAEISGREILFAAEVVRGVRTPAVQGEFTALEALQRMLAETNLYAIPEEAIAVRRRPVSPPVPPVAAPVSPPETTKTAKSNPQQSPSVKNRTFLALLAGWVAAGTAVTHAQGTGTIEGRVLNARSGEYLERARITVEGTAIEAFTDSGGYYRLQPVGSGAAKVRAFFTGFAPLTETVVVTAGATVRRDFSFHGDEPERDQVVRLAEVVVGASREMDGAAIAINERRFAANFTNVVTAGEFGISADGSVGEFIKYLPGISVDYVGGTANTVSLEGVPSNNVPVSVGGFDLASTASASTARSAELLQISIQNIARLEVIQSPTPESSGSALAGSINLVPQSAFERSRPIFTGSVYLMMRDNYRVFRKTEGPLRPTYKILPGADFSCIVPINKHFGFTLSGSYSKQFLPQDTMQTTWRGVSAATNGTTYPHTTVDRPYLTAYQLRDQIKFNNRKSFGSTLDYKLSPSDTLSFSYQYGQFDSEYNGSNLTFTINAVTAGNFGPLFTRGNNNGQVTNTNSARWRSGETHMPSLVYRHNGPFWKLEAGAGYSRSDNQLRDLSQGYFGSMSASRTGVTIDFEDIFYLRPGVIRVTDGITGAVVNPYKLDSYVLRTAGSPNPRDSIDVKRSVYANARRAFDFGRIPVAVKAGVDVRQAQRDMRGTNTALTFVGADGRTSTTPTAAGSDDNAIVVLDAEMSQRVQPFGFGKVEWMSPSQGLKLYRTLPAFFSSSPTTDYRNEVALSKFARETVASAYLRTDAAFLERRLKLIGGVRAEQTNVAAQGPLTDVARNYQRDASGNVVRNSAGAPVLIVPTSDTLGFARQTYLDRGMVAEKEYLRWFPSINGSYAVRENLIARVAWYTSVGRPDYNQYAGGLTLPDTELPPSASNRITVNNVAIKAWSARTTKARLEYYFEKVGQFAIGGFRRDFENFFGSVVTRVSPDFLTLYDLDPTEYGNFDVSTQYNIPNTVRMTGFEADYKQALTFLPRWARGIQAFANLTALRTTGDVNANFRGYVPRTYNWGISLNREKFRLRANWNYQGRRRLAAVTGTGIEAGTFNWRNKRLNLDIQGEYVFYKRFAAFANLRNVGAATEDFEVAGPNTPSHAQFNSREDYGASWTFGVRGTW